MSFDRVFAVIANPYIWTARELSLHMKANGGRS